ncbi:MAG: xanthine dehydrogenase family protein molybdopterin-binding subunit [Alphaproteobacteria bacterium]|nr:xanthine dehydrogenase family protein molybdopterin-binding subunit [Alphaproteobacteria bacterium]
MGEFGFGQSVPRKEDLRLLTGRGRYADDLDLPGQAHAWMVRSPHAHARILKIDASQALAVPGVALVLTGADVRAARLKGMPCTMMPKDARGADGLGAGPFVPEYPVLADGVVRFVGESVAMVVAETRGGARDAAERLVVDYQPLPAVIDLTAAARADAPRVFAGTGGNIGFVFEQGDAARVAAAFAGAERVVRRTLVNNRVVVAAMEPRGALGSFDALSGRYTLHAPTQMPHGLRRAVTTVMGLAETDLRVVVTDVGGSFGIKNSIYPELPLVLLAARRLGRPVKWMAERSDSFLADFHGRDNLSEAELALDRDGTFLALRVTTLANLGAYLAERGPASPTVNLAALVCAYRTPAIHVTVRGVYTHTVPTDVYRGAGRPESIYVIERMVDAAAAELGLDPMALRQKNLIRRDALPYPTPMGQRYDVGHFEHNLAEAIRIADLASFKVRRAAAAKRGRLAGIGFGNMVERAAGRWAEMAEVRLDASGRATALMGSQSNGQGHETAYAQIVADRLGLSMDEVTVVQGDTDRVITGKGTGGSASLVAAGSALGAAVEAVIDKGKRIAAHLLEAAAADVEFERGRFAIAGTDRTVSLKAVAKTAYDAATLPPGITPGIHEGGTYKPDNPTFPNGCHVCEVEVDPETGRIAVLSYGMVQDFGRVLNPLLLAGQMHGGTVQGLGQAVCERTVHDPESGQLLSASFMDYCLPRADDVPSFTLVLHEVPAPSNPLGVKGCGETGAAGAPPALVNAVLDALRTLGVKTIDMPLTPERVWSAIQAAGARAG